VILRVLGVPIESPQTVVNRMVSDIAAVARLARLAPAQFDRLLELGEEIAAIGRSVLEIAERLDERADAITLLGERLDARADELVRMGTEMREVGDRIDTRGGEIVESANRVVETGSELIAVLPAFERALEMATPLEGAIDRFGRLVDRLPGGTARRRGEDRLAADEPLPADSDDELELGEP
jgi:methyl-accepting chemotaxis protein